MNAAFGAPAAGRARLPDALTTGVPFQPGAALASLSEGNWWGMTTMIGWRFGAAAMASWILSSAMAWACSKFGALFKDDFNKVQASVWTFDQKPSVYNGHLGLRPADAKTNTIYTAETYGDVDICADVRLVYSRDIPASYVGIAFWVKDLANLYTFQITLDGYAGVYRLSNDKWTTIVKDKQTDAVLTKKLSFNEVRVATNGKVATLYVNGQKFGEITGEPPPGPQHVGAMVESPQGAEATYELDDFVVRPLQ